MSANPQRTENASTSQQDPTPDPDLTTGVEQAKDAEMQLVVSEDQMQARLTIFPARGGGKPVTREMIIAACEEYGIRYGVQYKTLESALQDQRADNEVIAQGITPQDGEDGYFEKLISDTKDRRPQIDEKGRALYNAVSKFVTVKPGDKLIKRIPATKGTAGRNIRDLEVSAKNGSEILFGANLYGADIDSEDNDILIATLHGQPVIVENGCIVEPTIVVDNVDMNSGNIEFEGTVTVTGNVTTGMVVKCSGDLHVQGMVEEACTLEVGGDLYVSLGIIGRGAVVESNGNTNKGAVKIQCDGAVSAKFIENAQVRAKNKIAVAELVAHSDIQSQDCIEVGSKGSKRGHIMGGITRAENFVQAEVLGSPAAVHTKIEVGMDAQFQQQLKDINKVLDAKKVERGNLETALMRLVKAPQKNPEKAARMQRRIKASISHIIEQTDELGKQKEAIDKELSRLAMAKIVVKRQAFSSVEITIGQKQQRVERETSPGTFMLRDNAITFTPS